MSATGRRTAQLLDQLIRAVEAHRDPDGTPVRDIAVEAGVGTMVVQRLLVGQGGLALRSFVALARWAGYDVTLTPAGADTEWTLARVREAVESGCDPVRAVGMISRLLVPPVPGDLDEICRRLADMHATPKDAMAAEHPAVDTVA